MWCLGNEMDGPWQIGHKNAQEYGRLAAETAQAMRMIDGNLELVVCGSSSSAMPTFGTWEATVLAEAYEQVDYISAHAYYFETDGDLASFLGSAINMDQFIEDVVATADAVRAVKRIDKRINISFDEWNVWYQNATPSVPPKDAWPVAPALLEDHYNVADAVVVGNLLISLLRHSDRVHAASLAQLVNVIAPIMSGPGGRIWRQTTFHPFALTSRYAVGQVLRVELATPSHDTQRFGTTPLVDAVATHDPDTGAVAVFAVNRSATPTRTHGRASTTTGRSSRCRTSHRGGPTAWYGSSCRPPRGPCCVWPPADDPATILVPPHGVGRRGPRGRWGRRLAAAAPGLVRDGGHGGDDRDGGGGGGVGRIALAAGREHVPGLAVLPDDERRVVRPDVARHLHLHRGRGRRRRVPRRGPALAQQQPDGDPSDREGPDDQPREEARGWSPGHRRVARRSMVHEAGGSSTRTTPSARRGVRFGTGTSDPSSSTLARAYGSGSASVSASVTSTSANARTSTSTPSVSVTERFTAKTATAPVSGSCVATASTSGVVPKRWVSWDGVASSTRSTCPTAYRDVRANGWNVVCRQMRPPGSVMIGAITFTSCARLAACTRSLCRSREISRLPTTTASATL